MPIVSGGYTDSRWPRNAGIPSYGVSGLFTDPITNGLHGLNDQVGVRELYDSKEYLCRLIKRLAAPRQSAVINQRPEATPPAGPCYSSCASSSTSPRRNVQRHRFDLSCSGYGSNSGRRKAPLL
jgi:hypothetical protein